MLRYKRRIDDVVCELLRMLDDRPPPRRRTNEEKGNKRAST
jgi:hypothetical protein